MVGFCGSLIVSKKRWTGQVCEPSCRALTWGLNGHPPSVVQQSEFRTLGQVVRPLAALRILDSLSLCRLQAEHAQSSDICAFTEVCLPPGLPPVSKSL